METKENYYIISWHMLILILISYTAVESPLMFILKINPSAYTIVMDLIISFSFLIDVFLNYTHTSFQPHDPLSSRPLVEVPYKKTVWPYIDVISAIPYELIAYILDMSFGLPLFRLIRLIRLIRIFKIIMLLENVASFPRPLKVFLTLSWALIFMHWIACIWMMIGPSQNEDDFTFYNKALYWTVTTLTTVGYGDITPSTNLARTYTTIIMITGIGFYGVIIGYVSQTLFFKDRHKEAAKKKIEDLALFMKHYHIPRGLRKQIFSFYHHMLNQRFTDNDSKIIADLPLALKSELEIYMSIKLINDVPIFQECDLECLKDIAKSLEHIYFSPNESIIKRGEIGNEFFIIIHGQVEVLGPEDKVITVLKERQFFGEIALITHITRTANVRSASYCDLYKLSKKDFHRIVEKYPYLLESIKKNFLERRQKD